MPGHETVFLLDVDNTLLDNDGVTADLDRHLEQTVGAQPARRYWEVFERLRAELGYADYLGALQRCRSEDPRDQRLREVARFLLAYPFERRLFPGALEVVAHLGRQGPTVVLSDGDVVLQPLKIERSGLARAVSGRVLVYVHKEQELDDVERRYPAERYVLVDDKPRILSAVKRAWGARVTTVQPLQGHYAHDPAAVCEPPPDVVVGSVRELLAHERVGTAPRGA